MSLVADTPLPVNSPPSFHLLAKPSGATCNIDCKYCFFLSKEALYSNDKQRMSGELGQNYLCGGLELFFKHTRPAMRTMAQLLQQRRRTDESQTVSDAAYGAST
jgi:sulfatase maturation enzyme AslB (radical SAM superfamily)